MTCEMNMLDISSGGAAVLADRASARALPVWIRLNSGAAGPDPLVALVVSTSNDVSGKFLVRARFTSEIALQRVLERHEKHQIWQRYAARETRARLAWAEAGTEYEASGQLVNISGGGAAVVTDAMLPDDQAIRLTLTAESSAVMPVESRLVAVSIDTSGLKIARLEFVEPCPMDLFELAVNGATSRP
jgi:PilZ domain